MNKSSIFNLIIILVILYLVISYSFKSLEHSLENQKTNYAKSIVCISFLFMVLVVNIVSNRLKFKVNSNKNQTNQLFKSINNNNSKNRCDNSNSSNKFNNSSNCQINNSNNSNNFNNHTFSSFSLINNNHQLVNKFQQDIRSNILAIPLINVNELDSDKNTLGKGSYGSVKKATFRGKDVAVKTGFKVDDDFTHNEMKCHTLLCGHKNIIDIEGYYEDKVSKMPSLVLELMDMNLREYLEANSSSIGGQRLSVLKIIGEIIDGVKYMHYNGFVHGDLHPGNILMKVAPGQFCPTHVKLSDFGLCKYLPNDPLAHIRSIGCKKFMSPESKAGGRAVYDKSDDIYSLGVLIWLLLNTVSYGERCGAIYTRFSVLGISALNMDAAPRLEAIISKCLGPRCIRPTIDELEAEIKREINFNEMNNWLLEIRNKN